MTTASLAIPFTEPDELKILVGGIPIFHTSAEVYKSIETGCDAWTATIEWTPYLNPALDAVTDKRAILITESQVYIGGKLQANGFLYGVKTNFSSSGRTKTLSFYSYTADLVDSKMLPPYEFNLITLEALAGLFAVKFPATLPVLSTAVTGGPFKKVTAEPEETIFQFLTRLARQRGVLITNTIQGSLLITQANIASPPVATIAEALPGVGLAEISANFDGRQRFNTYKVNATTPLNNATTFLVFDPEVIGSRTEIIDVKDSNIGNISVAGAWIKNKQKAEALSMDFPVAGFLNPQTMLPWMENTNIVIKSETIFEPGGFLFFIKAVKFTETPDGKSTILSLVPPESFSVIP